MVVGRAVVALVAPAGRLGPPPAAAAAPLQHPKASHLPPSSLETLITEAVPNGAREPKREQKAQRATPTPTPTPTPTQAIRVAAFAFAFAFFFFFFFSPPPPSSLLLLLASPS